MASEERPRGRASRKLTKKRREPRRVSLDIPERFRDGDDAQDDVTAPKRKDAMSMNQSLFSMIARAGQQSQTDLGAMQEVDSGDSDDEGKRSAPFHSLDRAARLSRISTSNDFRHPPKDLGDDSVSSSKHRRGLSEHKLLRSLPKLKLSGRRESKTEGHPTDEMSSSQLLPPRPPDNEPIAPSEVDRPLKQKPKVTPREEVTLDKHRISNRKSRQGSTAGISKSKAPVTLAKRLQQIFEFDSLEEVISGRLNFKGTKTPANIDRVPMLASAKYTTARVHVYHAKAHLLLRLHSQETCMQPP